MKLIKKIVKSTSGKLIGKEKASVRKLAYQNKMRKLFEIYDACFEKEIRKCLSKENRFNIFKVISAPMRFGKTRRAITHMIPYLLTETDCNVVILTSPLKGIIKQKEKLAKKICRKYGFGFCETVDQVNDVLDDGDKAVFITTNQNAYTQEKTQEFYKNADKSKIAFIVDECHTWTTDCKENIPDVTGGSGSNFLGTLYRTIRKVAKESPYIFGLTATPNNQHKGFVPALQNMQYELINDFIDIDEFKYRMGWFDWNNVTFYETSPLYGDQTEETFNKMIYNIRSIENLTGKKRCAFIETRMKPTEDWLERNDLPPMENPHINKIIELIIHSDFSFKGMTDKDGIGVVMTSKKKYIFNKNGKLLETPDEKTIYDYLADNTNPLRFLITIEMGKMGVDLPTVKEFFSLRENDGNSKRSKKFGWITEQVIQKYGRLLTCNPGIDDDNFYDEKGEYVGDIRNVPNFYIDQNKMAFYVVDNELNRTSMDEFAKNFAPDFNKVDFSFFKNGKKTIVSSKQERDAAYKAAQKDRCEREGCKCFEDFVTYPPIGSEEFPLSEEERLVNYKKGLQVDHVDRNLNNLAPENLKTYCPNAHSGKTMKYEDYMPK